MDHKLLLKAANRKPVVGEFKDWIGIAFIDLIEDEFDNFYRGSTKIRFENIFPCLEAREGEWKSIYGSIGDIDNE